MYCHFKYITKKYNHRFWWFFFSIFIDLLNSQKVSKIKTIMISYQRTTIIKTIEILNRLCNCLSHADLSICSGVFPTRYKLRISWSLLLSGNLLFYKWVLFSNGSSITIALVFLKSSIKYWKSCVLLFKRYKWLFLWHCSATKIIQDNQRFYQLLLLKLPLY